MTKEQALDLCVNDYQRQVVEATATATARTKQKPFYANSDDEDYIKSLLVKKAKKYETKAQVNDIVKAYQKALKEGFTYEQCVAALEALYKERRITELKEQMANAEAELERLLK